MTVVNKKALLKWLDEILPVEELNIDKKYFQDQLKKLDREYERLTVPDRWEPGLPYNSRTKHLWDEHKDEMSPELRRILEKMAPKTTGTLKCSTKR